MMRRLRVLVGLSIAGLAACSNAGTSLPGCTNCSSSPQASSAATLRGASHYADALRASLYPPAWRNAQRSNGRGWMSPAAKAGKNIIYTGNYDTSTISLFSTKKGNGLLGQITTGLSNPERLFVDKKLKLYATNIGNDTVTVYPAGATAPSLTISNGISSPTGITVGADGTVYVANVGNATITEYKAGQTSPSLTVTLASQTAENLAVDSNNNLYASTFGGVYEVAPGATTGTNLGLVVGAGGALEVDKHGNIIIIDENTGNVDVFPAGQTSPTTQVPISAGFPFELSLDKKEKNVYVSVDATDFLIQAFAYPSGTPPTTLVDNSADDGWPLAVSPDAVL